jgi:hypothetical protein
MPLPEKEYFALEEIEERWNIRRVDTVYYAENGLIEISMRVVGVVIETGLIETEADGRWFRLLEDHRRFSGLLTLRACDLAILLRRDSMTIHSFRVGEERYGDIAEPEDGVEVHARDLVVTRAERDRFEQTHALGERVKSNGSPAIPAMLPIDCSNDGGSITVHGRVYQFSGLLQKTAIRRLYEAWESGTPRLNMQALLEDIESGSRHISQVFGAGNRSWREIVGYSRGYVWLKADG